MTIISWCQHFRHKYIGKHSQLTSSSVMLKGDPNKPSGPKKSNFISVHCLFLRILFAFSKRKNSRQYDPSALKNIFDYRILFQILPNVIPQIHSPSIQMLSIVFCLFHNQFREQRELAHCEKWKYW